MWSKIHGRMGATGSSVLGAQVASGDHQAIELAFHPHAFPSHIPSPRLASSLPLRLLPGGLMSDATRLPPDVRQAAMRSISAEGLPEAIERQAAAGEGGRAGGGRDIGGRRE